MPATAHTNPDRGRPEPWVCPFCPLLCDDLSPGPDSAAMPFDAQACARATQGWAAATGPASATPRLHGRDIDRSDALAHTAERLRAAALPLIGGLYGDLADSRAALRLAQASGGVLDHAASDGLLNLVSVLQTDGLMTVSLGEARNRADLWIFLGTDAFAALPRLADLVLTATPRQHDAAAPRVLLVAPPGATPPPGVTAEAVGVADAELPDLLGWTRLLASGRPCPGTAPAAATQLHRALEAARFPVFVTGPQRAAPAHADLLLQALAALIRERNDRGRAALLPLGAGPGVMTAHQACAWHSGFSLRTALVQGIPEHDAHRYASATLVGAGEADLLVWINPLQPTPPPAVDLPVLAFGHPATEFAHPPELFFPLAVPGVHRAGQLHRVDGMALLPLRARVDSGLPSTTEVFTELLSRLESPAC